MDYKVDYHIHSTFSDGTLTPLELVEKYNGEGYDEIALTDHDSVAGIDEFLIAGKALKLPVITGIELSTEYDFEDIKGVSLHILGYKLDHKNPELLEVTKKLQESREIRNQGIIAKLIEKGYNITKDEIQALGNKNYIGRPDIARLLVKKGYLEKVKDAFEGGQWLESDDIKAFKRHKLSTYDAIDLINRTGGIPVLAHPIKVGAFGSPKEEEFWSKMEKLIRDLKVHGLKGLECIYPAHNENQQGRFMKLAEKFHLHITSGSDFHSDDMK